ncbi:PREDICTED: death-associated protein kinase 1-like [Branchiostoma belcheri]|uniref:non-specific serine/threonine protein kinase n=1 Tax=Branchiostoma belcheri TaxID=7741 RepID=A0A6P5AXG3_BRABE|nr:PREDICTED: death-associated protein kinase 1-like [Branchiostoma belcheri]
MDKEQFFQAVRDGDVETVRRGLEEGVDVNMRLPQTTSFLGWYGDTALHVACRGGHDEVVELLIKNQADLNVTNQNGDTGLHVACRVDYDKVVELLIRNRADLLMTNKKGDTGLHVACRRGNVKLVQLLIKNQADPNVTNKTGDTGLHVACRERHGKVVELLIRNRADLLITNKDNKRPVDDATRLLESTRLLVETETRKQAEYGELVSSLGSEEETTVKLFLSGDGQVGKTSLRAILEKTGFFPAVLWNIRMMFRKEEFNPTPGVHVSRKHVKGIGRLSLHDFAGQAQFYVTHAMLLRTTNAIFPVVYKITDGEEEQERQVHGWLSFINCSNPDPTNMPRIVLIASHADKLQDKTAGQRRAEAMVEHYRELFEGALVVSPEVFLMNCLEAGSADIRRLRDVLAAFKEEMLEDRQAVPKVCVQLMSNLSRWRKKRQTFPVLQWKEYLAIVRQDTPVSLAERTVQLASSYLHDIGEIIYLRRDATAVVVLSPQWLYTSVFGILLAPDNFPIDNIKRTAQDHVTYGELKRVFGTVADIPLLIKLLQDFQLCHTFDGHTFILPSLLQQEIDERAWSPVSGKAVYFGMQIRCRTEIDSFSCDLFPRLQTLLMQAHPDKLDKPLLWKDSAKCTDGKAEALLQISQDKKRLNIFVRSNDGDREDCNSIMDLLTDMAYKLLHETSPGARSQDMVLSALDLREHSPQPHAYSREEVEKAAAKGENVVHPQRKVPEKVKDLLLHLGNLKGMLGRVARKRVKLVETLRHISPVLVHLRADDVISLEENDRIRAARTPQDAARELLNILEAKGEQACTGFHMALEQVDLYAASLLD